MKFLFNKSWMWAFTSGYKGLWMVLYCFCTGSSSFNLISIWTNGTSTNRRSLRKIHTPLLAIFQFVLLENHLDESSLLEATISLYFHHLSFHVFQTHLHFCSVPLGPFSIILSLPKTSSNILTNFTSRGVTEDTSIRLTRIVFGYVLQTGIFTEQELHRR